MMLTKWNPARELDQMESRLARMFGVGRFRRALDDAEAFATWTPAVDVEETPEEYVIKADLPDTKKEDVKVQVADGVLTVEGERRRENEINGKTFHTIERESGKFVRRFALPSEVAINKVDAAFKDGVLTIHLPKAEGAKPKAIEVKVG